MPPTFSRLILLLLIGPTGAFVPALGSTLAHRLSACPSPQRLPIHPYCGRNRHRDAYFCAVSPSTEEALRGGRPNSPPLWLGPKVLISILTFRVAGRLLLTFGTFTAAFAWLERWHWLDAMVRCQRLGSKFFSFAPTTTAYQFCSLVCS